MTLTHLSIDNFLDFDHREIDFAPTLTVLLGPEPWVTPAGQLVYALYQSGEAACSEEDEGGADDPMSHVEGVFAPDDVADLRGRRGGDETRVKLSYTRPGPNGRDQEVEVSFGLDEDGDPTASLSFLPSDAPRSWATLLAADDVLTSYPAFAAADDDDELPLRRDEMDLCFALAKDGPLEIAADHPLAGVLGHLEELLGGRVSRALDGHGFVIHGEIEGKAVPLRAEGLAPTLRTLATLAIVLRNGALEPGGVLVWDRPDKSFAKVIVPVLVGLARAGVQIVVGTPDEAFAVSLVQATDGTGRTVRLDGSDG